MSADYTKIAEDKLVARVLREMGKCAIRAYGGGRSHLGNEAIRRANELDPPDPPKTRVDRIMERIGQKAGNFVSPEEYRRFASIRKILEEEGI